MSKVILPTSYDKEPLVMAEFSQVYKTFQLPQQKVEVLHDINFTIPTGSFTIIHGPSGSGKTTILNTLVGLERPTTGKVIINTVDLYELSNDDRARFRAQTIGMVHQDNYWVNSLTVEENVALPLLLAGWQKSKALFLARHSIARVGLEEYAGYNPTVLSGGQQQRISFARATVIKPRLLVADEPTGNLDSKAGDKIIGLLQQFNTDYKATVVLVTHNLDLLKLGTNNISIQDGNVVDVTSQKPKLITEIEKEKATA